MLARALGWAASSPNVTPAWPGSTPRYSTWRDDMIDPRRQVWQASAHVASGIARYRRAMRRTRCHTRCGTMRGTCQIAGEAPRAHRCSTGKPTSALACAYTVATSAARASGRMAVRYGGKACEGVQGCESRRAGPERAARPALARRRSFAGCSCLLRALWQVRSLCFPQGCSRATAAACQLAIAPALTCLRPVAGSGRSASRFHA